MIAMKSSALFLKLKHLLKRASSLLMLFQRTPAAQLLVPAELNLAGSIAAMQPAQFAIATVVGLGAFDGIAGATTLSQISPTAGSTTVSITAGTELTGPNAVTFFVSGSPTPPESWTVSSGTLPAGLSLPDVPGDTNSLTGTTTQTGSRSVTIRAWRFANASGDWVQRTFNFVVTAPAAPAITNQPQSITINSGQTATLSVTATGGAPLTYQWYQGASGNTSTPVGTNSASFTTAALTATTNYWVRVTNSVNPSGIDSNTAIVTVRQPAGIATQPVSTSIVTGQTAQLSVVASGTSPFTYQWYQGTSGQTATPVGTNSPTFTTPQLTTTTSYWVKITNAANSVGVNSNTATVTVTEPTDPTIFTLSPLPTARTNVAYTTTLTAFGGRQPYTWTVSDGNLPDGLTLSEAGVISGTSGATGTGSFTVQVMDQDMKIDTRVYELLVSDLGIATTTLPTAVRGTAYTATLAATGGSQPYTWSLQAGTLPAGITLSSAGVLSGTPTAAGDAAIVVRVTDDSTFSLTKALLLPVSATFIRPVLNPIAFPVVTVGSAFRYTVTAQNYPKTFTVTGLPRGLKITPTTGVISGNPEVTGTFNVQVRATNSAGASKLVTSRLTVRALPKNLVGTFGGTLARHSSNRSLGGQFSLTITSVGTWTLRIAGALPSTALAQGAAASSSVVSTATNRISVASPTITTTVAGAAVSLIIDEMNGNVSGTIGGAAVTGHRAVWNATTNPAETLAGYYSMALDLADSGDDGVVTIPQGSGYVTFTVGLGGSLTLAGRTADGESITTSTFLSSAGRFWVFSPLYRGAGSLHGPLQLTEDALAQFTGNTISGTPTWFKPTTATRTYAASFGPINLKASGGYLSTAATGTIILGLPEEGTVLLRFTDGGLADADMDPDVDATYTDDNRLMVPSSRTKTTLTLNANTGVMAGRFTLVENGTNFTRSNIAFQGQVVRQTNGALKAVGYFLLPQIPIGTQKPTDTPILSGGVSLQQLTP